jgi:hypothetical protein
MKFLIDIFKKSLKGDNYRATTQPETYNDGIAKLNAVGNNQYERLTTQKINAINKNNAALTSTTEGNTVIPGARS